MKVVCLLVQFALLAERVPLAFVLARSLFLKFALVCRCVEVFAHSVGVTASCKQALKSTRVCVRGGGKKSCVSMCVCAYVCVTCVCACVRVRVCNNGTHSVVQRSWDRRRCVLIHCARYQFAGGDATAHHKSCGVASCAPLVCIGHLP